MSRDGIVPLSSTFDMPGPMARSVEGVAIALGLLTGIDAADPPVDLVGGSTLNATMGSTPTNLASLAGFPDLVVPAGFTSGGLPVSVSLWIPGKPIKSTSSGPKATTPRRSSRYGGSVARALDNYRRRKARELKWKVYMVFQRKVMLAIDKTEPQTLAELERIPGLGPAKVERFGADILDLVRAHGTSAKR